MPARRQWTSRHTHPFVIMEQTSKVYNWMWVIIGDLGVTRPGYALFARMQSISPAYSTWCDAAPPILRTCEPHASTDTFVSTDKTCPCTYSYWYTSSMWLAVQSPEHIAQVVSTAAAVQTPEIFGVLAVFEVLHSLTLLVHNESSFCDTGTRTPASDRETLPVSCVTKNRSMYLVRMICVRTVPYTTYWYGNAVLVPKYARLLWYLLVRVMSCMVIGIFGWATDLEYEREWTRTSSMPYCCQ